MRKIGPDLQRGPVHLSLLGHHAIQDSSSGEVTPPWMSTIYREVIEMRKGSFQYHLESLYGTTDRALRLNPFLHKVDTSRGQRPNAVIMEDGNLMLVDRSGRMFRPSLIG